MSFSSSTSLLAVVVLCAAASSSVACGSGTTSNGGDGGVGSGGTSGNPGVLPDGTALPAISCGDENVTSASGTWDVVASGGKSGQGTAVLTIDSTSFIVKSSGKTLAFTTNGTTMTLQWTDASRQTPIAVTHTSKPVDTGLLPLPVGGQWSFQGQGSESCTASLSENALNTTCSDVRSTPFGRLDGTVVGIRQQAASSVFGQLGGTWHLTGAGTGSVDATISGNTFTAVVNGNGGPVGSSAWLTMKVCNGAAAGKSSSGLELAATRQ
ncbi:MAG: hypothetical protein JWP87_5507 [Labilithrix sp.]|nr:hypothetical protein [Labilithrix sp.]